MLTPEQAREWQDAALWQAKRGHTGQAGEPLPPLMSAPVVEEIANYPDEWQKEVRSAAYFLVRSSAWGRVFGTMGSSVQVYLTEE